MRTDNPSSERETDLREMIRYLPALILKRYVNGDPAVSRKDCARAVQACFDVVPEDEIHDAAAVMAGVLTALRDFRDWDAGRRPEPVPY